MNEKSKQMTYIQSKKLSDTAINAYQQMAINAYQIQ